MKQYIESNALKARISVALAENRAVVRTDANREGLEAEERTLIWVVAQINRAAMESVRKVAANKAVRLVMAEYGMKQYDVAKALGISEAQVSRMLREELPEDKQEEIIEAIKNGGVA